MVRTVGAVIAGLIVWIAIAFGLGAVMRSAWSAYTAVAETLAFSLPMLFARLSLGAIATLVAGWVGARFASHPRGAPPAIAIVLLAFFIPEHIQLWDKFPVWYHALFLLSLIPLAILGGAFARGSRASSDHPLTA